MGDVGDDRRRRAPPRPRRRRCAAPPRAWARASSTSRTADAAAAASRRPTTACSSTRRARTSGTLASRPDARWRKTPAGPEALAALQARDPRRRRRRAAARRYAGLLDLHDLARRERARRGSLPGRHEDFAADDLGADGLLWKHPTMPQHLQTLPHRDRTDGFFIAGCERRAASTTVDLGPTSAPPATSPGCARRTCPGRYRCVNCLHRFELRSVCPNCGEHSTIVRMSSTALVQCNHCRQLDAPRRSDGDGSRASRPRSWPPTSRRLGDAGRGRCSTPGARVIHVDVMDGHFVPPITMGPLVVDALADAGARRRRDDRRAPDDRAARAPDRRRSPRPAPTAITIHAEATPHVHYALQAIRDAGCRAGLALQPGHARRGRRPSSTPRPRALHDRQPRLGRPALHRTARWSKLERLRALIGPDAGARGRRRDRRRRPPRPCAAAGATLFVAGTAVFGAQDPGAAVQTIATAITR